jgi:hypothetical protein
MIILEKNQNLELNWQNRTTPIGPSTFKNERLKRMIGRQEFEEIPSA